MFSLKKNKCKRCTMHKKCIWHKNFLGFNLIQLVIVVGVAAIVLLMVLFNEDPVKRVGEARDAERRKEVDSIARAIELYTIDNGSIPSEFSTSTLGFGEKFVICSANGIATCAGQTRGCLVVSSASFLGTKLPELPVDPTKTSTTDTGYYVSRANNGAIEVGACDAYDSDSEIKAIAQALLPTYTPPPAPTATCGNGVLEEGESCDYNAEGSVCIYQPNYYINGIVYDSEACGYIPIGCSSSCTSCLQYCAAGSSGRPQLNEYSDGE